MLRSAVRFRPSPPILSRTWKAMTIKLVAKILGGLAGLVALVLVLWTLITLNYTYSTGERAGYVQKISERGWICKTWEGEIAMANLPGTMPQIFEFSVRDDAIAEQISK